MSLKVAVGIGGAASGAGRDWPEVARFAVESERLGVDFCWSAEAGPGAELARRSGQIRLQLGGALHPGQLGAAAGRGVLRHSGS